MSRDMVDSFAGVLHEAADRGLRQAPRLGLDPASSRATGWPTQGGGEATQTILEIENSEDAEVVNYVLKSDTTLSATVLSQDIVDACRRTS